MNHGILGFLHTVHIFAILVSFLFKIFIITVRDTQAAIYKLSALVFCYALFECIHDDKLLDLLFFISYPMVWVRMLVDLRPPKICISKSAVFITGCDSGFGHALAQRLDSQGMKVFAGCLIKGGPGEKSLVSQCSHNLHTVELDVTKQEKVEAALAYTRKHIAEDEELWALVNNAGVNYIGELEFADMAHLQKMMDVNCMGQVRMTRAFLPLIRASKGHVVNVASLVGRAAVYNLGGYCMSKYAVEAFSSVLRQEMLKWGVSVSVVEPGPFSTNIGSDAGHKKYFERLWDGLGDDVKEAYGWEYLAAYLKTNDFDDMDDPNITPVIDAMEDAVLSMQPKWNYKIGAGSYVLPLVQTVCPYLLSPHCKWIMKRFALYLDVIPKALQK